MNKNFMNMLLGLNNVNKLEAVKKIMAMVKEQSALDTRFYSNNAKKTKLVESLFEVIDSSDPFLETLIKVEGYSPYSIFSYVLNENYSDIMFYNNGFLISDDVDDEKYAIPDDLLEIYTLFINHFIENVMFLAGKKFDTSNPILDAEISNMRFNIIHKTLTTSGCPIIVIRKQTIKKAVVLSDHFINSLDATEEQVKYIQQFAQKGNFIIFGEVGSGKTTLLKYMANYKLEDKRNLCIIEDISELNIPVPISLLTNHHRKIKDLFIAALRQNPSSIIIGETRTDEIVDIMQAALTISVGTTIHANSFLRAIQRIVFMAIERGIPPQEILDLTSASIDCFIYVKNRKVKEVWVHKDGINPNIYEAYGRIGE